MIKGINRQVIEVSDTGNTYYERAFLVVRPQYTQIQKEVLEKDAQKLLATMDVPSSIKPKRNLGFWITRLGLAAFLGSALTILTQLLFF